MFNGGHLGHLGHLLDGFGPHPKVLVHAQIELCLNRTIPKKDHTGWTADGSRRLFSIYNLIFIVKDGTILNFIYIMDLNFIILQFKFLTRKFDFEIFVILMKI